MSEALSGHNREEIDRQLEILNPIRDRHSLEVLISGIAARVINNSDPYQVFVNPPESLPPINESSNTFVAKECIGEGMDKLSLYTTSKCGNCPYEHSMASYWVGVISHETGALKAPFLHISSQDTKKLSEMAQELIALRRSGELGFPVLDENLLTT